jgi:hypothetical protein
MTTIAPGPDAKSWELGRLAKELGLKSTKVLERGAERKAANVLGEGTGTWFDPDKKMCVW